MTEPTKSQVNQFVQVVDDFMAEYARLSSPATRAKIAAVNDPALTADYAAALQRGYALKSTIEATTGAWSKAKQVYATATDQTSMVIGDAVDWLRSLWGRDPAGGMSGLGAVQLPAAAWLAGIVASAYILLRAFKNLMIRIDAAQIRREDPSVSHDAAIARATKANQSGGLFSLPNLPLLIGGAAALWLLLRS